MHVSLSNLLRVSFKKRLSISFTFSVNEIYAGTWVLFCPSFTVNSGFFGICCRRNPNFLFISAFFLLIFLFVLPFAFYLSPLLPFSPSVSLPHLSLNPSDGYPSFLMISFFLVPPPRLTIYLVQDFWVSSFLSSDEATAAAAATWSALVIFSTRLKQKMVEREEKDLKHGTVVSFK